MRTIKPISLRVILTCGILLLSFGMLAIGPQKLAAIEPIDKVARLLKSDDFWSQTGAKLTHDDISFEERNTIRELAGHSSDTTVRIRAFKLLADLYQRTRYSDQFSKAQTHIAIEGVFRYLESNVNDETIARFRPELGFTHITTSKRSADQGSIWVLIEATDGILPSGGLNIRWSPTDKTVNKIEHWGANRNPLRQPGAL